MTLSTPQVLSTDVWINATWDEFVAVADAPQYEAGRAYFNRDSMRIEIAALGAGHGRQNSVVLKVVSLFAAFRSIRIAELINCSFRKPGARGCQPDIAFYMAIAFNCHLRIMLQLTLRYMDLLHW